MRWIAIAYAALDLRNRTDDRNGVEVDVLLVPTLPSDSFGLAGPYAELWLRLVDGPVNHTELTPEERATVEEYVAAGIASTDLDHPARIRQVSPPWLSSPLHELVYGLLSSVAREHGIKFVFIKGPALQAQGLRERQHSGDVDVWVDPERIAELAHALEPWGWTHSHVRWEDSPLYHSVTMTPGTWGCEIDIHRHMPGVGLADPAGFAALLERTENFEFAGVKALVPDVSAHAVVSALHLMRPQQGLAVPAGNEDSAVEVLQAAGLGALESSRAMRANASIRDVLIKAFPDELIDADYPAPLNWLWRAESNRAKRYFIMFRAAPIRTWPRMAYRSVWPDASTALSIDRLYGGTATSALDARIKRLKRGILQQLHPDE